MDQVVARLAELAPADQDPTQVASAITTLVDTPKGQRPLRVHIDPAHDGAEQVFDLGESIRADFYRRIGLEGLLSPTRCPASARSRPAPVIGSGWERTIASDIP